MSIDTLIDSIIPNGDHFHGDFFRLKNLGFYLRRKPDQQKAFFKGLTDKMQEIAQSDLDQFAKTAAIKHLTTLIPFAPSDENSVMLPIQQNGQYEIVEYQIEKISLTSKILPESDQYHALALTAKGHPSQLIFMGTAPLSVQGSITTVFADLFPFASIGWPLSRKSDALLKWSKQQDNIEITGLSLGGALSLAHASYLENVTDVDIFNPALPIHPSKISEGINVNVHVNKNDPVQKTGGCVPSHAKVYEYTPANPAKNLRWFLPHLQCYVAKSSTTQQEQLGSDYNKKQATFRGYFSYFVLRPIGFVIFLPFYIVRFVIKSIIRLLTFPFIFIPPNHKPATPMHAAVARPKGATDQAPQQQNDPNNVPGA
jgi:hypothetical protein